MEWHKVIEGALASSPLAVVLAVACGILWRKLEAKDAELVASQEHRIADLKAIADLEEPR